MATSVFPATGGFVDNTSAATFIPEIWLVLPPTVRCVDYNSTTHRYDSQANPMKDSHLSLPFFLRRSITRSSLSVVASLCVSISWLSPSLVTQVRRCTWIPSTSHGVLFRCSGSTTWMAAAPGTWKGPSESTRR